MLSQQTGRTTRFLHAVAGPQTRLGRLGEHLYRTAVWRFSRTYGGPNFRVLKSTRRGLQDIGIYAYGGCDMPAVFALQPFIRPDLVGDCCIRKFASTPTTRADLLLQSLEELPRQRVDELVRRLRINPVMFQPELFEEEFRVEVPGGQRRFPKSVIVLSVAANAVRTVYRDKETGILVDPGGLWFNRSIDAVLKEPETVAWFQRNFESVGRMPLTQFRTTFARLVREVRARTNAHVVVFNVLCVEPGIDTHNYQFVRRPLGIRLRSFNLALAELSRELDFDIVDVDFISKSIGTQKHIDPFHDSTPLSPAAQHPDVARALFDILVDRGVLPAGEA